MQNRFINNIKKLDLLNADDSVLLGLSGGIDSMVMLHLFIKSGFNVSLAHCNFGLRGLESDGDEEFVIETANASGIKLHIIRFDTELYASQNKVSIQTAARDLRYKWFNDICKEFNYNKIAIAHNLDDVAETVLLNLTRGSGLKGLTGIKSKNGIVVRPLLFATRKEIEEFAKIHNIKYRSDSSNDSIKYKRNFIRHNIITQLEKLNPSVKETIASTANHLNDYWKLIEAKQIEVKRKIFSVQNDNIHLSINEIKKESFAKAFLIEELTSYGFSPLQIEQIYSSINSQPGKIFLSKNYCLTRDREYFILSQKKENKPYEIKIEKDCKLIEHPIKLECTTVDKQDLQITKNKNIGLFDANKLEYPLTLRVWGDGDSFKPFGMKGHKKVSDFLIDQKVPVLEKNDTFVLLSGNEIIWVIGFRISDDYKVVETTQEILKIELSSST